MLTQIIENIKDALTNVEVSNNLKFLSSTANWLYSNGHAVESPPNNPTVESLHQYLRGVQLNLMECLLLTQHFSQSVPSPASPSLPSIPQKSIQHGWVNHLNFLQQLSVLTALQSHFITNEPISSIFIAFNFVGIMTHQISPQEVNALNTCDRRLLMQLVQQLCLAVSNPVK